MVSKELKRLSRRELIDIIYQMKKNEQEMQEKITSLQNALQEKRIRISKAGSIAEAAVSVTDILSNAQTTADLYLHEISCMKEETEQACARLLDEANRTAVKVLSDSQKKYNMLRTRYRADYKKWQMLREEVKALEEKKNKLTVQGLNHGEKYEE